jgi:transcriptional regulator MraZ
VEEKGKRVAELLGQHRYQLDAKGRVALPARFREAFADGVYLTLGQERCLTAFPAQEWQRRTADVRGLPQTARSTRSYSRMFFGFAERADLDRQGRLVIPQRLRERIGLTREAVVLGRFDHLEVWSGPEWDRYEETNLGPYLDGTLDPEA